jgi:hypothetical protein
MLVRVHDLTVREDIIAYMSLATEATWAECCHAVKVANNKAYPACWCEPWMHTLVDSVFGGKCCW